MDIPAFVASVLMIAGAGLVGALLSARIRILPLAAWFVCGGALLAVVVEQLGLDTGIRASNFKDLVFYVLLPVLIYEAAYAAPKLDMRRLLPTILLLATVGMAVSVAVGGYLLWTGVGHGGFSLLLALLVAVMLSATDPIAVVSQLKALSAQRELQALLEGESLFNDAVAIVLFSLVLFVMASAGEIAALDRTLVLVRFAVLFLGGVVLGLLVAAFCEVLRNWLSAGGATVTLLGLFAAYGSFYLAEHWLHVSGVMAVLSAGLWTGARHEGRRVRGMYESQHEFWDTLSYVFNMVVFVIMGLVLSPDMFVDRWRAMLVAIVALLVARTVAVYFCTTVSSWVFRQRIDGRYRPMLVWGGLRGVIAMALVLSLYEDVEHWYTVQSMVYAAVLFSLFVQASTTPSLMRALKLVKPDRS